MTKRLDDERGSSSSSALLATALLLYCYSYVALHMGPPEDDLDGHQCELFIIPANAGGLLRYSYDDDDDDDMLTMTTMAVPNKPYINQ